MVGKSTIGCAQFGRKLDALYEVAKGREDRDVRLTSDAETAKRCGRAKSTLSTWRNGASDKDRAAGMLQAEDIQSLAEEVSALTDGRINASDAYSLWTGATYPEFRRALLAPVERSLFSALRERPPTVTVQLIDGGVGLGMIEETLEPLEGQQIVDLGAKLRLKMEVKKNASLIIIGTGPGGRFLLAPGPAYDGKATGSTEIAPPDSNWTFKEKGPHSLHVVELRNTASPIMRGRGDPIALSPIQEQTLAEDLLDPDRSGPWRRGEVSFFVRDPNALPSIDPDEIGDDHDKSGE